MRYSRPEVSARRIRGAWGQTKSVAPLCVSLNAEDGNTFLGAGWTMPSHRSIVDGLSRVAGNNFTFHDYAFDQLKLYVRC